MGVGAASAGMVYLPRLWRSVELPRPGREFPFHRGASICGPDPQG